MKAVCESIQTWHVKVEVLSHSVHTLVHIFRDSVLPGMTQGDWNQAKAKGPIINQTIKAIQSKS